MLRSFLPCLTLTLQRGRILTSMSSLHLGLLSHPSCELTCLPVLLSATITKNLLLLFQSSTSPEMDMKSLPAYSEAVCAAMNIISGSCPGCLPRSHHTCPAPQMRQGSRQASVHYNLASGIILGCQAWAIQGLLLFIYFPGSISVFSLRSPVGVCSL